MVLDPPPSAMETQSAFMAAAAATVLLGAVLRRRRDRPALLFAALTAAFASFAFARGAQTLGLAWAPPLAGASLTLLGPLVPAAAAVLVGRPGLLRRLGPIALLGLPVLGAALLGPGTEQPTLREAARIVVGAWAIAGVLAGSLILMRFAPDPGASDGPDATRIRYLGIAQLVVALAALADALLWKLEGPRVAGLLFPLLYLYVGYLHLAQVRVADLRQLMGNTVALTLMALGLTGAFAAIRIWAGTRLDLFLFNSFLVSFVLLLFFPAMRSRIQHGMDRTFMAPRLELERALAGFVERLVKIRTLDELLKDLLGTVERTGRLRSSSIFLRNPPHLGFQQVGCVGLPPRKRVNLIRDPSWIGTLEKKEVLVREEIERAVQESREHARRERLRGIRRIMEDLDAQLVFPLRAGPDVLGFWTLSEPDPRESFSSSEVRLLRSVADRIAVSLENSKTFERIRARDRMASLGEMATGLAHEIRNPLATIQGALAVMQEAEAEAGVRGEDEFREVVLQEIARLDRVVGAFLDYARPSTRRALLEDVEGLVRDCVRAVTRLHPDDGVEVTIESRGPVPPLYADADQLERVIMNLLGNAYEALAGHGAIRVLIRADPEPGIEDQLEISVTDDGPGMDEKTLERALIPFFTTRDSGTGLGLALCEKLIRSQGGSIQIHSEPGAGTRVRVRLPFGGPEDAVPEVEGERGP